VITSSKFTWILEDAQKHFDANMNWVDFGNRYFSQGSKFLPTTDSEMNEYLASSEYQLIQEMRFKLEGKQKDVTESAGELGENQYSGKFIVRAPKSVHRMLVEEAKKEGVSLNQLCVAKLARPLTQI
jgi:predicted HicB family RNase H-like nuclease